VPGFFFFAVAQPTHASFSPVRIFTCCNFVAPETRQAQSAAENFIDIDDRKLRLAFEIATARR
jgi:hypothetical protein